MSNWRQKLAQFMQGRYGPDQMYKGLLGLFLALTMLNLFLRSAAVQAASLAVIGYALFRVLSKDRTKRAAENQRYTAFYDRWKKKVLQLVNRFKERDTHRYRECPNCKTTLRLQKKIGVVHVKCPRCKTEFDVNIRR